MGYMHIDNLYKNQAVLMFRTCYALEKVHGTSAHITYRQGQPLILFSGGENHARFAALFDHHDLAARFFALGHPEITVYSEAYGGSQQGMRLTYGGDLRFIAFDVMVGEHWLSVPDANHVSVGLDLEFVPFVKASTDLDTLDRLRDQPSVVAELRGCGSDKPREGVVLRPPIEVRLNNGDRIIAKHKGQAFSERVTPQKIVDPAKLEVLAAADAIAQEWVTPMRLTHVLDKLAAPIDMKATPVVIAAMVANVYREAYGEVVESKVATAAIGKRTAALLKERLASRLPEVAQ